MALRTLSLFTGVGGLDLGLRIARPDARTVCYVEGEAYAAATIVARMEDQAMDEAPIWSDITTFDGEPWRGKVDCVVGGFPCTDISTAGKRVGIDGKSSGLWREMGRIIGEVRPSCVFVENVSDLLIRGWDRVLGDLSEMGYRVAWGCLRAYDVGYPHQRNRLFALAYADGYAVRQEQGRSEPRRTRAAVARGDCETLAYGDGGRFELQRQHATEDGDARARRDVDRRSGALVENANGERRETLGRGGQGGSVRLSDLHGESLPGREPWRWIGCPESLKPAVRRDADGLAYRMDRLRACGNGVVPLQAAVAYTALARALD